MKNSTCLHFKVRPLLLAIIIAGSVLPGALIASEDVEVVIEQPIPTSASGFYYTLGGGTPLPKPLSFSRTARINANYGLGAGYSCASFDPFENVETMINQLTQKLRRIPNQFFAAAQAGIIGMPGYILNKANPALYENITKTFDDAFELFNMSFKSEQETARGDNPYQQFVQASIADNWATVIVGSDGAQTVDQVEQTVIKEGAKNGIDFVGGIRRGGTDQDPIKVNYEITVVGYNSLLGHSDNLLNEDPPAVSMLTLADGGTMKIPMVKMFSSPKKAAEWLVLVVGETEITLSKEEGDNNKAAAATSKAGRGLMVEIEEHTFKIRQGLEKAVLSNDYTDLNQYDDTIQIGFMLIDAIRSAGAFEQGIMLDRLSAELAVNYIQNRVTMVKRMLYAGLREASLGMSGSASPIISQIRKHTLTDLDAAMGEIHESLDLKLKTLGRTTSKILSHGEYMGTRRSGSSGTSAVQENSLQDGAVKK
ncbi:MAG: hypothetical protein L3J62_10110 [Gammaproteobacteria bacterium]|nr:hypothetical protein [Gammaproteobacteria bacterium]